MAGTSGYFAPGVTYTSGSTGQSYVGSSSGSGSLVPVTQTASFGYGGTAGFSNTPTQITTTVNGVTTTTYAEPTFTGNTINGVAFDPSTGSYGGSGTSAIATPTAPTVAVSSISAPDTSGALRQVSPGVYVSPLGTQVINYGITGNVNSAGQRMNYYEGVGWGVSLENATAILNQQTAAYEANKREVEAQQKYLADSTKLQQTGTALMNDSNVILLNKALGKDVLAGATLSQIENVKFVADTIGLAKTENRALTEQEFNKIDIIANSQFGIKAETVPSFEYEGMQVGATLSKSAGGVLIDKLNAASAKEAEAANAKNAFVTVGGQTYSTSAFGAFNEEKLYSQANAALAKEAQAVNAAGEVNYLISGGLGEKMSAATSAPSVVLPPVSSVIQAPTSYNSGTNIAGGAEFVTPQVIPQSAPLVEFKEGTIEAGIASNVGATYEIATLPARAFAMPEETYKEVSGGFGEWVETTKENPIEGLRQPAGIVTGIGVTILAAETLPALGITGLAATGTAGVLGGFTGATIMGAGPAEAVGAGIVGGALNIGIDAAVSKATGGKGIVIESDAPVYSESIVSPSKPIQLAEGLRTEGTISSIAKQEGLFGTKTGVYQGVYEEILLPETIQKGAGFDLTGETFKLTDELVGEAPKASTPIEITGYEAPFDVKSISTSEGVSTTIGKEPKTVYGVGVGSEVIKVPGIDDVSLVSETGISTIKGKIGGEFSLQETLLFNENAPIGTAKTISKDITDVTPYRELAEANSLDSIIAQKGVLEKTGGKTIELEGVTFIKKAEDFDNLRVGKGLTADDAGFADVSGGSIIKSDANLYQEFAAKTQQKAASQAGAQAALSIPDELITSAQVAAPSTAAPLFGESGGGEAKALTLDKPVISSPSGPAGVISAPNVDGFGAALLQEKDLPLIGGKPLTTESRQGGGIARDFAYNFNEQPTDARTTSLTGTPSSFTPELEKFKDTPFSFVPIKSEANELGIAPFSTIGSQTTQFQTLRQDDVLKQSTTNIPAEFTQLKQFEIVTPRDITGEKTRYREITIPKDDYRDIPDTPPPIGGGGGGRGGGGNWPAFGGLPKMPFGGKAGKFDFRSRDTAGKTRYNPSLAARVFNIRGKRPAVITGSEIRPLIGKPVKKARNRKR